MRNLLLPALPLTTAALLPFLLGACSTTSAANEELNATSAAPQAAEPTLTGVVVPAEHAAISLWPEAYSGELLVLEVRPEGTPVVEGDVLAKLDTRTIDDQIADAQLEFESARIAHEGLLETNRLAQEAGAAALARARAALARSRHALDGYENHERPMQARADELMAQREGYRVDDQKDELDQLEAMYEADELTDATEEIVLKRSRRNLQATLDGNALGEDRRQYRNDFEGRNELEKRREDLEMKSLAVEHMVRKQAVEQAARDDGETRSTANGAKKEERLQQLKRDLGLFTVRAPRAGVLLHGKLADYRPGKSAKRLSRASKVAARDDVMLVAEPSKLAIALDVPDSMIGTLKDGARVSVRPLSGFDRDWKGRLTLATCPTGNKGDECLFAGDVALDNATPGWTVGMRVRVEAAAE